MKILSKKLKTAVLVLGVALGMMFGTTQQSKAAFYNNYLTQRSIALSYYYSTGNVQYLWGARAYYYYYLAGYYADYSGYYSDRFAYKSTQYAGSTWAAYYYNTYTAWGDYYARL